MGLVNVIQMESLYNTKRYMVNANPVKNNVKLTVNSLVSGSEQLLLTVILMGRVHILEIPETVPNPGTWKKIVNMPNHTKSPVNVPLRVNNGTREEPRMVV